MANKEYTLKSGKVIKVNAVRNGVTSAMLGKPHYKYRITISCDDVKKSFTFHDSIYNYIKNVPFGESGIDGAMDCIFLDAYAYEHNRNFYEFCREYGWEEYTRESRRVFNGCMDTWYKLLEVIGEDEIEELNQMIYEIVNE